MRLLRFEKKILGAILIAGVGPLLAALWIGSQVLEETYRIGVNEEVQSQLAEGVEARRSQILSLREQAGLVASIIAADDSLVVSADSASLARAERSARNHLEAFDSLLTLELRSAESSLLRVTRASNNEDSLRELSVERALDAESSVLVRMSFGAPESLFVQHARAGQFENSYVQLLVGSDTISSLFLTAYLLSLTAVIGVLILLASLISRRVTRRVATLREATLEAASGNLGVQVPVRSDDEIAELTEAFNQMFRDVESSQRRIGYLQQISAWQGFARRLAHEIKNPLTPIQLAIQDVSDSYAGENEEHQRHLQVVRSIIEEEVQTLRGLVTEFSEFARLPLANREPLALVELTQSVANALPGLLKDIAGTEGYDVQIGPVPEGTQIFGDLSMLRRALLNLIQNSAQALQGDGRETGRIELRSALVDQAVEIEILDDGPGLEHGDLEQIFQPYVTTKEMGSGLGLAIVKKIAFEHGGSIEAGQSAWGGARFSLRIPTLSREDNQPKA